MGKGKDILLALKARLETITTANSYATNVKLVEVTTPRNILQLGRVDLPLIQIIQTDTQVEHNPSALMTYNQRLAIVLAHKKDVSDFDMEDFLADVNRCIFGGAPDASGNTGVTLGGLVTSFHLREIEYDVNTFEANRIYIMWFEMKSNRRTWEG